MARRGIAPDRDTWNLRLPVVLRARMDPIRDAMKREKGRAVTFAEVLEYLLDQEAGK